MLNRTHSQLQFLYRVFEKMDFICSVIPHAAVHLLTWLNSSLSPRQLVTPVMRNLYLSSSSTSSNTILPTFSNSLLMYRFTWFRSYPVCVRHLVLVLYLWWKRDFSSVSMLIVTVFNVSFIYFSSIDYQNHSCYTNYRNMHALIFYHNDKKCW